MKRAMIDATDVTRKALLGTDRGWYESYWYTGGAETETRLLARLARRLAVANRAIRQAARSVAGSQPPRFGAARGSIST